MVRHMIGLRTEDGVSSDSSSGGHVAGEKHAKLGGKGRGSRARLLRHRCAINFWRTDAREEPPDDFAE